MEELDNLQALCKFPVRGGLADKEGKTNVLMQALIIL